MTILLVLLLIPPAAALATTAFFWYETASSPHRAYLIGLSNGRLGRLILRGVLSGICGMFLTMVLLPLAFVRRLWRPARDPDTSRPPVILIHGLYHNRSGWTLYRHRLRKAGFRNLYFMNYFSFGTTLASLVDRLETLISEVNRDFPDRPPVLVGHSLGGLIARAWLQRSRSAARIRGVITLGTPHQGSKLAALGPGRLAAEVLFLSDTIREIENAGEPPHVPRIALYSPIDNMVLPHQALLPSAPGWVLHETAPVSHVTMLYHRGTAQRTIDYLEKIG